MLWEELDWGGGSGNLKGWYSDCKGMVEWLQKKKR